MRALLLLLAVLSHAASRGPSREGLDDKALLAPPPFHWFKTYSLSPYREFWSLILTVDRLDRALPKVRASFDKAGAALTQPFESFPSSASDGTQQLSYRLSGRSARAVLKRLKKLGDLREPGVRPSLEPVPLDEVKEKLRRLEAEREARSEELSRMPAVSALVEEAVAHLSMVRAVRESADSEVLVNLTLRQRR